MKERPTYLTVSKAYFQEAEKLENMESYIGFIALLKMIFSEQSKCNYFFCHFYIKNSRYFYANI